MIEFLLYKNENNEYCPIIRELLEQTHFNIKSGFKYRYYVTSQDIIYKYKKRITKNMLYTAIKLYSRFNISSPILCIRCCSSDSEFLHKTLGWNYYFVIYSYVIYENSLQYLFR